jgi:hypothetical protein
MPVKPELGKRGKLMWIGTQDEKDALLKLSDTARLAVSPLSDEACHGLRAQGFVTLAADGFWQLSRAGWEHLVEAKAGMSA